MASSDIPSIRRNDLDWLRVLGVLLLVPFHCALVFTSNPEAVMYIKDGADSWFLNALAGWIHRYHMPVLFYVAGASTFFALSKRTKVQYLRERFFKLLVPALAGIVLLVPPMTYISLRFRGVEISFWQHFVNFWHINPADLDGIGGTFTPAHLWFLIYLFIFSLLALPAFSALKKERCLKAMSKFISIVSPFGVIAIPVILSILAAGTHLLGSINPIYYFLIFVTGFLFMCDGRIQKAVDSSAPCMLILGLLSEAALLFFSHQLYELTGSDILLFILGELNRWFWTLAFLGIGHRCLTSRGPVLKYLNAASFPFYILHLLVATAVAAIVVKWSLPVAVKYLLITLLTFALTFGLYEMIRRISIGSKNIKK